MLGINILAALGYEGIDMKSFSATSTTSLEIASTGSKTLTIQPAKAFSPGQFIILAYTSTPTSYMIGQVTTYNSSTGSLELSLLTSNGTGTYSDWSISIAPMVFDPASTAEMQTGAETNLRSMSPADIKVATDARAVKNLHYQNIGSVSTGQNLDTSTYNYFILEPTADLTLTFTNASSGMACIVELLGSGDHALTWAGGTFTWDTSDGLAPTGQTGTDSSIFSFVSPDGTNIYGKVAFEKV